MSKNACPFCGFDLATSTQVARLRRVIFECCPFCGKRLKRKPCVAAHDLRKAEAKELKPVIWKRLED